MIRFATVWLGGCSGCHMSFLDLDEWLFELADRVEPVYSPLMDVKEYPAGVDLALVEGAVANTDNLALIRRVRANTTTLVSLGDCAVTGNITALRNPLGDPATMLERVYVDGVDRHGTRPDRAAVVPELLPEALPVHRVVPVDVYLPGCPPDAPRIRTALTRLLDGGSGAPGAVPDIRFG